MSKIVIFWFYEYLNLRKCFFKKSFHLLIIFLVGLVSLGTSAATKNNSSANMYIQQQDYTVTGKVIDNSGMPLPGVNIIEKGTSNGTMSDFDGKYTITVSSQDALLSFSFVGMRTVEKPVAGNTNIDVTMTSDSQSLNEVVVVGYGTQKKVNLTGSVSQLQIDDIVSQPVSNPVQLLYGRVSGLQLEQTSGVPGSSSSITVRGPNINNGDPLIVIDGMQAASLDEVSPSDIASFSILKDAASASIYGARGANGVILITTKSGKRDRLSLTFNSSVGTIRPTDLPHLLMGADFARAKNEREFYQGSGSVIYTDDIISQIENGTADPNYFGNDNWFDALFRPALYTDYYLSASGGSEKARYFFSMRYNQQEGTLIGNSQSDDYNFRTKLDFDITNWLTIGTNIYGNRKKIQSPLQDVGSYHRAIFFKNPLQPIRYTNGDYSAASTIDGVTLEPSANQLFLAQIGENVRDDYNLNAQVYAKVSLAEGLTYEPTFVYRFTTNFERSFNPTWELYDGPDRNNMILDNQRNSLYKDAGYSNFYQIDNLLRYKKDINENNYLGVLLGHQLLVSDNFYNQFGVSVQDFASNNLRGIENGVASTLQATGGAPTDRILQSYFGRLEYRLFDKYLLEVNMRLDGGSQFPKENRYGIFPSVSAGWKISEENFMKSIDNVISSLKLRASWGKLGSLNNLSLYPYQQTFGVGADYIFGPDDAILTDGAAVNVLANSKIKFEATETTDIGLDMEFFHKLSLTADWYRRDTHDILLRLPIPITAGDLTPPFVNAGEVRNQGWELSAGFFDTFRKNFDLNLNFNISSNTNKVLELPGVENGEIIENSGRAILREGEPLYSYYGLVFDGIYQSQEEIDNGPTPADGKTAPGYRRYVDINGDGKIDTDTDRTIIGNSFPKYVYGFNTQMGYKNFDLSLTFSGVAKIDRIRPNTGNDPDQGNMLASWKDRWSPTNPSNEFPVVGSDRIFSSWNIIDGSYLRLKTMEFGYTIPTEFSKKFSVDKFRVYVSGTNLLTFTNYIDGFDPENSRDDFTSQRYPLNQTFVFGVNVKL